MDTTTTTQPYILTRFAFMDALVRQIGPERVADVTILTGNVHLVDEEDGHEVAADLGLTSIQNYGTFTTYTGDVDGHPVTVFASAREHVVVDSDTGEVLTGPMSHYAASAIVLASSALRHLQVREVAR